MRDCLWVVEERSNGEWVGWDDRVRATRKQARRLQKYQKVEDASVPTRIRKYVRVTSDSWKEW